MRFLRSLAVWLLGGFLLIAGLVLGYGGMRLILLGGSWYYIVAGIGFIATSILIFLKRREAPWLYALVVLGTLAWSVWEVGLDWWPLAARGDIVFLVGFCVLVWSFGRWFRAGAIGPEATGGRGGAVALAASLAIAGVVGIISVFIDHHDRPGRLAMETTASSTGGASSASASPASTTAPSATGGALASNGEWTAYGGTHFGQRYSPLDQITPSNADKLQVAWEYHTKDIRSPQDPIETTYEVTPLKVGNLLYICTPHNFVIALDAETGKERWRYDPKLKQSPDLQHLTCRGLSYHTDTSAAATTPCAHRLFMPTADARLLALDAATGKLCEDFGNHGEVDLWRGMPELQAGFYYSTSPPVIADNLVIIGGNVSDNVNVNSPSGVIRAYDAKTGELKWNWDSGNPDNTQPIGPDQHYTRSSPNSWSISSADEQLGLIYIPMGNQPPDQFGAKRSPQTERFSSAIVALDIDTGQMRWVFQTVHHDLWDMDVGSQPSLIDLNTPQGVVPALVAPTKRGDLYVLDRRSGKPIVPVEERTVPRGTVAGDTAAPTQPFSALTFLPPERLQEKDMWGATMFDQLACRVKFRSLRYDGIFTPPSLQGTLVYPGNFGIFDWGGIAVDPVRQIAFANPDYMGFVDRLIPREQFDKEWNERLKKEQPAASEQEEGKAPAFPRSEGGLNPNRGAPFGVDLEPFLSLINLPCQSPPWGYIAGIDLRSGKIAYMHKNGTIRDSSPVPLPFKMGVPSLGGPIITAGGVAFLTSTLDYYIRAYGVSDGKQLWEGRLPAGGQATPMSYWSEASQRQFVIAVAGGHGSLGTRAGDAIIAYALPKP
ncbi:glucose/quinate/shikimate family membrane-bound PQQ-dependent dehydrogenase [Dongia soli]|uniref:Glucose/quinate/shikimate family membrane-bound PQQ-dependent dehydrogenase n=1 Tax=Dongia soli TaxID=600628 RepID=A0ABU5EH42_9PROT|nr:glucose/quinate/shikimate family membrane-bound PQQ-dependent dehydrogenase [Dongia soli]MDY0885662.1 glucose/quinate/shikimate family membrane-bound PQQ-dependent dehydrogenase [Dongia soli]